MPFLSPKDGVAVSKAAMVAEIRSMAEALKAPAGRYTGHSLRVTGAQRMALAGIPLEQIRVFGRWSSNQALKYTRGTVLNNMCLGSAVTVEQQAGNMVEGPVGKEQEREEEKTPVTTALEKTWHHSKLCRRG